MLLKIVKRLSGSKALFAVLFFALILRVLFIWSRYLGNDESYTLDWISNGFPHFVEVTLKDTSPPLFYFMAFVFNSVLGIYGFYLLSILFGFLSILMLYKIVFFIADRDTAILSALLISVSTMFVLYSQHLRPYAFIQFIVLAAAYAAMIYMKGRNNRMLFVLSVLFLVATLTYYPSIVPFVLIYAWIFVRELRNRRKPFAVVASFLPAPILFGAMYFFLKSQISNALVNVYVFPLVEDFFYFFYKHFAAVNISTVVSMFPWAIFLGLILCALFVFGVLKHISEKKFFILYLIFGSIGIYYVAYFKFSAILYFKHMSSVAPLLFIFPSVALIAIRKRNEKAFWLLLAVILALSIATLCFYYWVITSFTEWVPLIGH